MIDNAITAGQTQRNIVPHALALVLYRENRCQAATEGPTELHDYSHKLLAGEGGKPAHMGSKYSNTWQGEKGLILFSVFTKRQVHSLEHAP